MSNNLLMIINECDCILRFSLHKSAVEDGTKIIAASLLASLAEVHV
jgi:hypothetical protein